MNKNIDVKITQEALCEACDIFSCNMVTKMRTFDVTTMSNSRFPFWLFLD